MDFLNNISIKNKHLIILGCVILGLVLTTTVSIYEFNRIGQLSNILLIKEELTSDVLNLRKHEKDFFARKDLKYGDKFSKSIAHMKDDIVQLESSMASQDLESNHVDALTNLVSSYGTIFSQLVSLQTEIGLDAKSGFYGSLRASVHEI